MLSVQLNPAWKVSVANHATAVVAQDEAAQNISDDQAKLVAELFKPRLHKPRVLVLPSEEEMKNPIFVKLLDKFVDPPDIENIPAYQGELPRVEIDQAVLLDIACMTALSPKYEVRAFLGVERDAAGSRMAIRHFAIAPRQKVTDVAINSDVCFAKEIPIMAEKLQIPEGQMYSLFHGDAHTHVKGFALPSDADLSLSRTLACGGNDDLNLAGVAWHHWWVGFISNLHGVGYLYLFDAENRRFICDLSWEVTPAVADPIGYVKQRLAPLLREMQREVVLGKYQGEPDGLDEHEPDDVMQWEPEGDSKPTAGPAVTVPRADGPVAPSVSGPSPASSVPAPAVPLLRRHRGKLAAAVLVALGIGLYAGFGSLPHSGVSSEIAVVAKPVETEVTVPVGQPPAFVPAPAAQTVAAPTPEVTPTTVAVVTPPPVSEPKPTVTPPKPEEPVEVVAVTPVETPPLLPETARPAEPAILVKLDEATPLPTAPQPAPASAGLAKVEVASTPKSEPPLEPWQQKLVDDYQGLELLPPAPQKVDMELWKNVRTETLKRFANFTWRDYSELRSRASDLERTTIEREVVAVFVEQYRASKSYDIVETCLVPRPSPTCIGIDRAKMEELIKHAATYLGDKGKPLAAVYQKRKETKRR